MINNFIERRFPVDISYGSSGGPEYYTEVLSTTNGNEIRSSKIYNPRMKFNITNGLKNKHQMEKIMHFFRCCKGRKMAFRYKDWCDFYGKNEQVKIIDRNTLQLIKTYNLDYDVVEERIITKPVENTVIIRINDKPIEDTQMKINYNTGRIILLNHLIDQKDIKITADFEFDVPVRFDTDYLPVIMENYTFYSLPNIELVEVKV